MFCNTRWSYLNPHGFWEHLEVESGAVGHRYVLFIWFESTQVDVVWDHFLWTNQDESYQDASFKHYGDSLAEKNAQKTPHRLA